jgi:ElaB/YqjD/DUF883 family membrane-anchored ribosome-binding protein
MEETDMVYSRKRRNANGLDARIRALQGDFEALQKDMRKLFESVGDVASSGVSDMTDSATKAASGAVEQVEHWAEDGVGSVRDAIREQPLAAIAISMGAGAIIGSLLRR